MSCDWASQQVRNHHISKTWTHTRWRTLLVLVLLVWLAGGTPAAGGATTSAHSWHPRPPPAAARRPACGSRRSAACATQRCRPAQTHGSPLVAVGGAQGRDVRWVGGGMPCGCCRSRAFQTQPSMQQAATGCYFQHTLPCQQAGRPSPAAKQACPSLTTSVPTRRHPSGHR